MDIQTVVFTSMAQDTILIEPGRFFMAWPLAASATSDIEMRVKTWLADGNAPAPVPLEQIKEDAMRAVDEAAERARLCYITPGAGQALEYETTRAEAARALAVLSDGGTLDPADYLMLEAERMALQGVGASVALEQVAQSVDSSWRAWLAVGAAIKQERRRAKLAIKAATSVSEVQTLLNEVSFT